MSRLTQNSKILRYIEEHGSITPLEAMNRLRVMRLAARIRELEKDGVRIIHEMVSRKDEDGHVVRFMRYRKAV